MLFSSPLFLFCFLPVFALVYVVVPARAKNAVILVGSILFYSWSEPKFVFLVMTSTLLDWVCSWFVFRAPVQKNKLGWLWLGILANVALLIYFKYANFFIDNLNPLFSAFHLSKPVLNCCLPIGVSFIVFEKITYLVDVYKGLGKPAKNVFTYMTYVFLFPKLLAGPIVKYHEIEEQLSNHSQNPHDMEVGFLRFLSGLAKKVLIADTLGPTVDAIFASGSAAGTWAAWIGAVTFGLQIYFDFSGYSDMAIGMAMMMGFRLRENFHRPYVATSFTDFWHRWHISLSSWIREYLYIPLGGSKVTISRTYLNLWLCFLLSGLWHGAAWTFVIWGAYHGFGLILDKLFWLKLQSKLPRLLSQGLTLFFVLIGWVLFRCQTIGDALSFLRTMFVWRAPSEYIFIGRDVIFVSFCAIILSFANHRAISIFVAKKFISLGQLSKYRFARGATVCCMFFLCIARASANSFHPFLYFRF